MKRSDFALGARLALSGGRQSVVRLVVTTAGVAVGVALLLIAGSIETALRQRDERVAWRDSWDSDLRPPTAPGSLLWRLTFDRFEAQDLLRVDVAPHDAATAPPDFPGLDELPGPGEVALSARLAELIDERPADQLGDRYGTREITAILGDAALEGPDDLVAVVGWDTAELADQEGVTSVETLATDLARGQADPYLRAILVIGAIALLMPVGVLVATATRLAAAQREQRLATLRLVGASPAQTRRIAATEGVLVGLVGAVGAVGGIGLFLLLQPAIGNLPLNPFNGSRFFAADLAPAPGLVALVLVATPLVAAAAAVLSLRRLEISPLGVSRRVPVRQPSAARLLPLALALPAFAGVLWYGREQDLSGAAAGWSVGGSFAAIVGGLVFAGPVLVRATATWLARHARGAAGLMAARRLVDDPRAGFRAIGGVVLAVFVATLFFGIRPSLDAADSNSDPAGRLRSGVVSVHWQYGDPVGTVRDVVTATPGAGDVVTSLHYPATVDGRMSAVMVGSCDELAQVLNIGPSRCADSLVFTPDGTDPGEVILLDLATAKSDSEADSMATIETPPGRVGQLPGSNHGYADVLIDPSLLPPGIEDDGYATLRVQTDGRAGTIERIRTALASQVPGVIVSNADDHQAEVQREVDQISRAVTLALLATLLVAGCSVAIATVGGLLERRRPFALLRLSGVPLRELRGVVLREAALPLLTLATTSALLGLGVAWMVVRLASEDDIYKLPSIGVVFTLAAGLAAALAVVVSILPLLNRLTSTETTRFE